MNFLKGLSNSSQGCKLFANRYTLCASSLNAIRYTLTANRSETEVL